MDFFEPFFFPAVIGLAVLGVLVPRRHRWLLLLTASLALYYLQGVREFALLGVMLAANIGSVATGLVRKRGWLAAVVAFDVCVLMGFKYVPWLVGEFGLAEASLGPLHGNLPLGLSFYTFQLIAYVVDSHRAHKAILRPQHAATFITFFPQLVAGPILRVQTEGTQFAAPSASSPDAIRGLLRLTWGIFKKRVLADSVAPLIAQAFANPGELSTASSLFAGIGFALQLYLDFSAYADMAIGMGSLFGIRLPENFDRPYLAASLRDFWRRWHITLSTWLRDYLYIPLGGSRASRTRTAMNTLLTMALGGLWHGANWTFLVWGLWHGFGLIAERAVGKRAEQVPPWLRTTFVLVFVTLGWILFRANSLTDASLFFGRIASFGAATAAEWRRLLILLAALLLLLMTERLQIKQRALAAHPLLQGLIAGTLIALTYLAAASETEFIYWRF